MPPKVRHFVRFRIKCSAGCRLVENLHRVEDLKTIVEAEVQGRKSRQAAEQLWEGGEQVAAEAQAA